MKVSAASIALLGLPLALAAIIPNDAARPSPNPALRVSPPSPEPTSGILVEETNQNQNSQDQVKEDSNKGRWDFHDLLRLHKRETAPTVPLHNTFTSLSTSQSGTASASSSGSSSMITSAPATGGEIAVFTDEGLIFTVSKQGSQDVVDGKTLIPGGPGQMIGDAVISEGSKGAVVADGQTLSFSSFSSSSASVPPETRSVEPASSLHAGSGSSSAGAQMSSSTSNPAAMPTAGAKAMALVGAVVGVMVL